LSVSFSIECFARTKADLIALATAVKNTLHCWRADPVRFCRWTGTADIPEELGFHSSLSFSLWMIEQESST
jgi:hypothetical protein